MLPGFVGPVAPAHGLGGAKDLPVPASLAIAGGTALPRLIDFEFFRNLADEVGAIFWVDAAHFIGLGAGTQPAQIGPDDGGLLDCEHGRELREQSIKLCSRVSPRQPSDMARLCFGRWRHIQTLRDLGGRGNGGVGRERRHSRG